MEKAVSERIKSYCNECLHETNHHVHKSLQKEWVEEHEGQFVFGEKFRFELIECCGCENVTLRRTYCNSGQSHTDIDLFPPAASRKLPKWLTTPVFFWSGAKGEIRALLKEIYSSTYAGNRRVAMMGARAVIDVALTDKLGDIGTFEQKLEEAENRNWVTAPHAKVLKAAIDAGNAATHRAYCPEPDTLELVLDILEHLIQLLYVLEAAAQELSERTPRRLQITKGVKLPPVSGN
jgi:hypothetical protein